MSSFSNSWSDELAKFFADLRHKNEDVRQKAVKQLVLFVGAQLRELSGEHFSKLLGEITKNYLYSFVGNSVTEKLSAISVIDELLEIEFNESDQATIMGIFGTHLRIVLNSPETNVISAGTKTLGHLVRVAGLSTTAETVDAELKRAVEWLGSSERFESRRYAAVLLFKELAIAAPTLFNIQVQHFVEHVWNALNDQSQMVREAGVEALRACLDVIASRQSSLQFDWYRKLYQESQKALNKQQKDSSPSVHGALLALGELLINTGNFMQDYFKETCETVLRYRESKDKHIKKAVITLLPRLAAYSPEKFSKDYLNISMDFLMKRDVEKSKAYLALGELAIAIKGPFRSYLQTTIAFIKPGLQAKKKSEFCVEVLVCMSMLATAVGAALRSYVQDLLPDMLNGGLSEVLTSTLRTLGQHIPTIMPDIQEILLHFLASILGHKFEADPNNNNRLRRSVSVGSLHLNQELSKFEKTEDTDTVALALRTLGSFDFETKTNVRIELFDTFLKDLLQNCVMNYLTNDNPLIRKEAALTCSKLVATSAQTRNSSVMSDILDKLLIIGISDRDDTIRRAVLASLDTKFDYLLALPENLSSLFLVLNDEVFQIRELAITIIGRLTIRNPAFVMPSLRRTLVQLLGDLQFSGDSRNKEESARLLSQLIRTSYRSISSYVDTILDVLLPKLKEETPYVASTILEALGNLCLAGGPSMHQYIPVLMPIIIETLQNQSSVKREVAIRTLGLLAGNLGYVIRPYADYPQLLDILLGLIKSETNKTIRREVIRVIGILGALDPYKYKMNQFRLKGSRSEATGKAQAEVEETRKPTAAASSNEKYFPTVAINALVRVMRDQALSFHYRNVIGALMPIIKSLGNKSTPFLPQIMPPFLQILRNAEQGFRDTLFQELRVLVDTVKEGTRDYLREIFDIIKEHWSTNLLQIIALVEDISVQLKEEFKVYLPNLIPPMLKVLHTDTTQKRLATRKVLHALEVFETNLEDYLHLVIPAMVNLFEQDDPDNEIHKLAAQTLGRLCSYLNFSDYASRVIHPTVRLLDNTLETKVKDQNKTNSATELRKEIFETLCSLVQQLGSDYAIFVPLVNKVLLKHSISEPRYETMISRLMKNQPLKENIDEPKKSEAERKKSDTPSQEGSTQSFMSLGSKLKVNTASLQQAWAASHQSTKEDWLEWIRRLSTALLKESPSPALRSCLPLAQEYSPLVRELFNAAFISCWAELDDSLQKELVANLEIALESSTITPEILTTLLNLAEFMEHEEKPLPFSIKLGEKAAMCRAYAKALYYKEEEFLSSPSTLGVEALIGLNNQLSQPKAATGILKYAQENHNVQLKDSWYEQLQRWEEALASYEGKKGPQSLDTYLGHMRCLHALGEWNSLHELSLETWKTVDEETKSALAPFAAASAWNLAAWESMAKFLEVMPETTINGNFYRAILAIHNNQFSQAQSYIIEAIEATDTELTALIGESYTRAYSTIVKIQQLIELEEVIEYKQSKDYPERLDSLRRTWRSRLLGCQRNVDTWQNIMAIRSLVLTSVDDMEMKLRFASLCRKSGRMNLARKTLTNLLGSDPSKIPSAPIPTNNPPVALAYIKHMWATQAHIPALERLKTFAPAIKNDPILKARAYQKLGEWQLALEPIDEHVIPQILASFKTATELDPNWYKAWHSWALVNFQIVSHYEKQSSANKVNYIVPAVKGFFRSITLNTSQSLQDTLRLLNLWFKYGSLKEVETALSEGFNTVSIDTWLQVIPQIIARIAAPNQTVRRLVQELLTNVGKAHPQALVFPLTVALKSQSPQRVSAAKVVVQAMRKHSEQLIEEALIVSNELVRVAILWNEMWLEGLEDASRFHFAEHNPDQAIARLKPLHDMIEKGPETLLEKSFQQTCGRDLQEALEWTQTYKKSGKISDFNQAWDLYYNVFRHIKQLLSNNANNNNNSNNNVEFVELEYTSPKLLTAKDLQLAVPGTYRSGEPVINLQSFSPSLEVLQSKQRPRKLTVYGSDGANYVFLLKGHEDLRQDERVMQLFGLVNTLLGSEFETSRNNLSIQRYSVVPLAPNSGLIGWVPHCDTLHGLIRSYRDARKIPVTQEHRLLLQMSPDYINLCIIQKVEVFKFIMNSTDGMDLKKILWLQSKTAEVWLERRTNYTRSLATMSMVGYILGLGDRHCSNLMLDRQSGKIVHIDFGDCFEVAMERDKLPEKVPFRLTRMLINAMGVSGIEGNFRSTCESVMRVLRENKESLMAVLEAFVYDPLISWRLLTTDKEEASAVKTKASVIEEAASEAIPAESINKRDKTSKSLPTGEIEVEIPEGQDDKAVKIIGRISNKLTGKDFSTHTLDVQQQVQKLIKQATDVVNLCQGYLGWSPYW